MGKLEQTLFRCLARLAKQFDSQAVKALICRQHGKPLPPGLDAAVARFLGHPQACYYWPSPTRRQQQVLDAVRDAWRDPLPGATLEDAFAGVRYLTAVLAVARKHGLLDAVARHGPGAAAGEAAQHQQAAGEQQEAGCPPGGGSSREAGAGEVALEAAPSRGAVLVAHPCQPGSIFSRSVVLLCRHEAGQGSYGLILNKPLGSSLKDLHEKLRQLRGGLLDGSSGLRVVPVAAAAPSSGSSAGQQAGSWHGSALAAAAGGAEPDWDSEEGGSESDGDGDSADDIPADLLQRLADERDAEAPQQYYAAHAALQAVLRHALAAEWQRRSETDESGNWIEPPYQSESEEEVEEDGEDEEDAGLTVSWANDEEAGGGSDDEAGLLAVQGSDPSGVLSMLSEALRAAGGGTVVMLDPGGQVWAQHLVPGEPASEDDEAEHKGQRVAQCAAHDGDGPAAIADLLLRCLTPADQQLLRSQHHAAKQQQQQQQQQRQQGESASGEGAWEAGRRRGWVTSQPHSCSSPAGYSTNDGSSSSSSSSSSVASRVQRLRSALGSLVQQTLAGNAEGRPAFQPAAAAASHPLGSSGAASWAAEAAGSRDAEHGGASSSSTAGDGEGGSGGDGGDRAPLSELMSLFADSPLFRGGPVPGLQVLHCRPRLGGELVLAPGGAQAAPQAGSQDRLEGGILVGADLTCAQALVAEGYLSPGDVRVCMGDSAWSPGQLEGEVAAGMWAVARVAPDFLDVFGPAAAAASTLDASAGSGGDDDGPAAAYEGGMWSKCLGALGGEYAELARVPRGAWQDLAELEV